MKPGIFAVYKPKGISSYDVIRRIKEAFPGEKIGHGGTLDPLADGVLVIGLGREATKQLHTVLNNSSKVYVATIALGTISDSDDGEGPLHLNKSIEEVEKLISKEGVAEILRTFVGDTLQTPPIFSAIKQHGKPLYLRARKGEKIVVEPREIHIDSITLLSYELPKLSIEVTCSSGVYIRALARDIGEKLGTGAYMSGLTRTKVGDFTLSEAEKL